MCSGARGMDVVIRVETGDGARRASTGSSWPSRPPPRSASSTRPADDVREQRRRRGDPDEVRLRGEQAPGCVREPQAGGGGAELVPELLAVLNRRLVHGVMRYLAVRWRGHTSDCQEKAAEYDAAAPRCRAARRAEPALGPADAPPVPPPAPFRVVARASAGFRLAASLEGLAGTALVRVSQTVGALPLAGDGWPGVRGTVAARSRAARFSESHVVPRIRHWHGGAFTSTQRGLACPPDRRHSMPA